MVEVWDFFGPSMNKLKGYPLACCPPLNHPPLHTRRNQKKETKKTSVIEIKKRTKRIREYVNYLPSRSN